ncbi:MAG: Gfo/Idh/MocA family oxidoreductase [Acidimicrobiia bacterium]
MTTSSSAPIRFGIAGAGGIAASYATVISAMSGADIVGVADVDRNAAEAFAAPLGAAVATSVEELLQAVALDALVVCTPPDSHPAIARAAFAAGVAVLCEKPLAIAVGAAQEMVAAATRAGVLFTMATKFRFVGDVVRADALIASGIVGDVIQLENAFASRVDMTSRWNSNPAVSGGGVLIDNGTHSVDIARYLLGPIHEVLVIERPRTQGLDVEDSVQMLLRSASGSTATIDLSWSYDHADDTYLQLYGSRGAVRVGWRGSAYRTNDESVWVAFGEGYDKIACMRRQVVNFCGALRHEVPLVISDADAIASVQVIDAAYRSLAIGDWVAIDPIQAVARRDAPGNVA